jgi:hypothetical protein
MLNIERTTPETFTFVSDDANAENAVLGDAVSEAAPHLLSSYGQTEVGDDGLLRWEVGAEEWPSLLEIIDIIDADLPDAYEEVEEAIKERAA